MYFFIFFFCKPSDVRDEVRDPTVMSHCLRMKVNQLVLILVFNVLSDIKWAMFVTFIQIMWCQTVLTAMHFNGHSNLAFKSLIGYFGDARSVG